MQSSGGMDPETIRASIKKKKRYRSDLPSHYESYKQAVWDNLLVRAKSTDSFLPAFIFLFGFVSLSYKASGSLNFMFMDFIETVFLYALCCILMGLFYKYKFWTRNKLNVICMFLLAIIIFYVLASPPLLVPTAGFVASPAT